MHFTKKFFGKMSSSDEEKPDLSEDPDEPPPRTLDERVIDIIVRTTDSP